MRIVLSNTTRNWGGVQEVTRALVCGLQQRGHEVLVLCRPGSRVAERLREVAPTEPILGGMDLNPFCLWRVGRALRRFRPDAVIATMKKDVRLTAPVARLLGVPVVVRHASDRPLRNHAYHRLLYGSIPAYHVANSRSTRATLLSSAPWLDPEHVGVIYNGIDADRFLGVAPAPLGLPPGALAIGFLGRMEGRKGVLDLAEAWPGVARALPRAHLVLAGGGRLEEELRRRLAPQPRVHWIGYRDDVPAVMAALDIVAMPSHWEGFGLVAAEAMAAGKPVVVGRASSLPEIVRDGVEGRLVAPRAPEELARALVALGADPGLRARMGRAGAQRVRVAFSMARMLDGYEEVLRRVARCGAGP